MAYLRSRSYAASSLLFPPVSLGSSSSLGAARPAVLSPSSTTPPREATTAPAPRSSALLPLIIRAISTVALSRSRLSINPSIAGASPALSARRSNTEVRLYFRTGGSRFRRCPWAGGLVTPDCMVRLLWFGFIFVFIIFFIYFLFFWFWFLFKSRSVNVMALVIRECIVDGLGML